MVTKKKKKSRNFRYFSKPDCPPKPNPFDLKVNHKKYSYVSVRAVKGESGRPTESRSRAIEIRKARIERHLRAHERVNKFSDRRVGEHEPDITEEQKSLMRLQAFKSSTMADIAYQPDCPLTTNPKTLIPSDDDEGEEVMEALWSDGGENQNDKFKEAIAKAKLAKAERVREKSEVDETTLKMNVEWETMKPLLRFRSDASNFRQSQPDEYDSFVQSLRFVKRTKNTDRTMNFESKKEYIDRMEKEAAVRMKPPHFELRKYISPDDLDDVVHEENESKTFCQSRPLFLTELSHVSDEVAKPVPDSLDLFLTNLSDSELSLMLSSSNPLRTGGNKSQLVILANHIWSAFCTVDKPCLLLVLAKAFQTIVYHYPEEIEPLLVDYLEHSFEKSSVNVQNSILRLISLVYSVSDYRHQIGSMALCRGAELLRTYSCETVDQCRNALNTCLIMKDYIVAPGRVMPEMLNCLYKIIKRLAALDALSDKCVVGPCSDVITGCPNCLLLASIECLRLQMRALAALPCWPLFSKQIIDCVDVVNTVPCDKIRADIDSLKEQIVSPSTPPNMIVMKTPRVKARFEKMSRENDFRKKIEIRRRYKKELRCTAREIKREGQVLSGIKLKRQKMLDEQRMEKVKRIMADLADQEGDYRKMKKAK